MAQQHQKILFGFLVMVTLTLQGCALTNSQSTEQNSQLNTEASLTGSTSVETNDAETPAATDMNHDAMTGMDHSPSTQTSSETSLNGTFHLTSTYNSPAGPEPLDATVTIKNDVITAVEAKNVAHAVKSKMYQDMFISGIAGQVVGKNIADVKVTYVNGSSLTAQAFDKALHALEK